MFWRRQALLTVRPTRLGIMRVFQPNDAAADTAQNGYRARRPARTGRAPTSRTALRSAGAGQHVLVSAGLPSCWTWPLSNSCQARHDRTRPHAAGVLRQRLGRSAMRARTPSTPTATPFGCSSPSPTRDRQGPSQLDIEDLDASRSGSSTTSRTIEEAASPPATPASRPSTPSSASPPTATPSTPRRSSRSWPSPARRPRPLHAPSSPVPRWTPSPPRQTSPPWCGRRDHVLLVVALRTGLRLSELTGLRCRDVKLGAAAHVKCLGKGRKRRDTPLDKATVALLRAWLVER